MAKINADVKDLFDKVKTVMLATADADGMPNAVPMGAKTIIDDETILLGDQFFNKTLANLETNPQASISFWEGMKGYQIKGKVEVTNEGPLFEAMAAAVAAKSKEAGLPLKTKNVALLKVEAVYHTTPGPKAGTLVE